MNIQDLIRPIIKSLKPYSSARDEFKGSTANMIFLDANESPFENGVNRYPDAQQKELKMVLSKLKGIPTENILLGNGSDEVLDLLIRMFCEPNKDNIIILPPTYGMYEVLANVNAVEVRKVNLASENFQPVKNQILDASDNHTKILFICSPNNPTGNSINARLIEELLTEFKGIIVVDEAYIDFSNEESWLARLNHFPNLIVTQTLSKAYGMAGIRLGIGFASADIISVLNTIKPPYNINELTQKKAIEQLQNPYVINQQIENLKEQRLWLEHNFKAIRFIESVFPSDANFLLIKVDDANFRYDQLISKGIVIRNRTSQPLCENCLRLTVGTMSENEKLIQTFKELNSYES